MADTIIMPTLPTLDQVLAKTPDKYKPFVVALGPGMLALAANGMANVTNWVMQVAAGDVLGAFNAVVNACPDKPSFLAAWDQADANMDTLNAANAAQYAASKAAMAMILQGLLGVAGLLIGF